MLFRRKSRVQCWYCSTHLQLLPSAPSRAALAKGKGRAVESTGDGPVAVGTRDEFWCGECGQITKTDQNGEVVSDDAAFFDSSLNEDSFAKRGSPSRHRLPPSFPSTSTTPFCRQCLANQSLQLHLLASYPSDSDADEDDAAFPPLDEYRRSLDARYPLVCASCAPAVEGTIRERDYRVKAQALGWRLRESQRAREREERVSEERRRREGRRWALEGWAWRARGAAWAVTGVLTAAGCCACLLEPALASTPLVVVDDAYRHVVVPVALLSLFWSFWDPTWSQLRSERVRGRSPSVQGRRQYLAVQMLAYLSRLLATCFFQFRLAASPSIIRNTATVILCITLVSLFSALYLPRLKAPPPFRLISQASSASLSSPFGNSTPASARFPASADPLEPLAHLSLSRPGSLLAPSPPATPTATSHRVGSPLVNASGPPKQTDGVRPRLPSFGLRAWRSNAPAPDAAQAMDVDAPIEGADADTSMDWAPTPPGASASASAPMVQHITFARQRFVPPDLRRPTGLEGMFERVVAVREECREPEGEMQGVEMAKPGGGGGGWWTGWLGAR